MRDLMSVSEVQWQRLQCLHAYIKVLIGAITHVSNSDYKDKRCFHGRWNLETGGGRIGGLIPLYPSKIGLGQFFWSRKRPFSKV